MQDEQALVKRAQEYDQEAFAQIYEENFDKIFRYIAIKIGNQMEAEDLTQQVFMKALKAISSYKWKDVPFSAWLYKIAHNQVVDYFRKKNRRPETELNEDITSVEDHPYKAAEFKVELEELSRALKKLTHLQQEVISLRFSCEMPIAQVAIIMGKKEGAIKALQHSAIQALRKHMVVEKNA
ncbi:MAG: ECF subfamily RNA polymerase sigma factor, BldN family [Dehalococcoidales bacterium]|nr:sigma-70 family RNA polymerase sigma factor [Dehalococcoidales bacterium]MDD3264770.1 sigma-70 family RNA polymerase sigma factor [Dehalococcoidales bacterium]MDD4322801.1 sigma-70 family RNA polymerase sigma factor [Dehalococcoidales bacterium]MDD4794491.1 sigma-70 family RNA polymerase sigma factor [Dehalococcoidales bacterium]MDD5122438.1 sigma-70 family RNA polymerase sigma factor [Dehalococcoidales bacterium]